MARELARIDELHTSGNIPGTQPLSQPPSPASIHTAHSWRPSGQTTVHPSIACDARRAQPSMSCPKEGNTAFRQHAVASNTRNQELEGCEGCPWIQRVPQGEHSGVTSGEAAMTQSHGARAHSNPPTMRPNSRNSQNNDLDGTSNPGVEPQHVMRAVIPNPPRHSY